MHVAMAKEPVSQQYIPIKLCNLILQGIWNHFKNVGMVHEDCIGFQGFIDDKEEFVLKAYKRGSQC